MRAKRAAELEEFARGVDEDGFTDVVLAGMGGSSLAPEVFRRTFEAENFHVLDTTHPDAIRALEARLDLARTLFLVVLEVGDDARDALPPRLLLGADRRARRAVRRHHRSGLGAREARAQVRVPRDLGGASGDRRALLGALGVRARAGGAHGRRPRAAARAHARDDGGLPASGRATPGSTWACGSARAPRRARQGAHQPDAGRLRALGRAAHRRVDRQGGQGPRPGRRARRPTGPDRQSEDVRVTDPYELGQEFFRWEFATAVAGSLMGINPFDQPNVQAAKDTTKAILDAERRRRRRRDSPFGSLDELLAQARAAATTSRSRRSSSRPTRRSSSRIEALRERVATGCVVTTAGSGPRYLHSTGQLHKGGPATGSFLQVVDEPEELGDPRPHVRHSAG